MKDRITIQAQVEMNNQKLYNFICIIKNVIILKRKLKLYPFHSI